MPCIYSPDSCNCKIIFDKETSETLAEFTNKSGKRFVTLPCKNHSDIPLKDLYSFIVADNQACNSFYEKWTNEEIISNIDYILKYKIVYAQVPDVFISGKSCIESIKEFRG